jgi:N-acylneuraminate cytidylyltransferase
MICWTIDAAKNSQSVDSVVVSTDDRRAREIALEAGAEVPFVRPSNLAKSSSSSVDVALHALDELERNGRMYDYLLLLQPTSPLRTSSHVDRAANLIRDKCADAVISVTKSEHPEEWAKELSEGRRMDRFTGSEFAKRSQDLPERYRVNGAIYLIKVKRFKEEKSFFLQKMCFALEMELEESIDIDTKFQFEIAQMLLEKKLLGT